MEIGKCRSILWFSFSIGSDYFYKLWIEIILFKRGYSFYFFKKKDNELV